MNQELNSFHIGGPLLKQIIAKCERIKPDLIDELIFIKNKSLLNKFYQFVPVDKNNLQIQDLIGQFKINSIKV